MNKEKQTTIRRYLSRSRRDGTWHYVRRCERTGQLSCSCPGWRHHRHCWHVARVLESMGIAVS